MSYPNLLPRTLLVFCLLSCSGCQRGGQAATELTSQADLKAAEALYQRAIAYKDYRAAGVALLELIDLDPPRKAGWLEKLAEAYHMDQRYEPCGAVCEELVALHEGDRKSGILEMQAMADEALGRKQKAMETWARLMKQEPTPVRAARFACLLLDARKISEADEVVQAALASPLLRDPDQVLKLPMAGGRLDDLPVEAALQNLLGLVAMNRSPSDPDSSRAAFERALQIAPSYLVARRNLEATHSNKADTPTQ